MTDLTPAQASPSEIKPNALRRELICLLLLIALFLAVNLATYEKTPAVWIDEVAYADPAINLYQGFGFTSASWYAQSMDRFWAGNVPLYPFILFTWLKLAGFSLFTVRAFHYVILSAALGVAWLAVWRMKLIATPFYRLVFCTVLCCCSPATFVFRSARPETICILLVALVLLAVSLPSRATRLGLLFLLGAALTCSGLQMAAYVAVISGLIWLWGAGRFRSEMIALGIGCAVGLGLLYALYASYGVWGDFITSIRQHTVATKNLDVAIRGYGRLPDKLRKLREMFVDYSVTPVLLLALLLAVRRFLAGAFRWRSTFGFGVLAGVIVPLALFIVGVFPIYYYWMSFGPLFLGVCAALAERLPTAMPRGLKLAAFALLGVAALGGLPRRLVVATTEWQGRRYAPVMSLVAPYSEKDRVIYCEYAAYYAAKQKSARVILQNYLAVLTPAEAARISVAIIRPDPGFPARNFGGVWRDTGARWVPARGRSFFGQREQLGANLYHLRVYERVTVNP